MKLRLTLRNSKENITIISLLLLSLESVISFYTYKNNYIAWISRVSIIIIFCGFCLIPFFAQKTYRFNYKFILMLGLLVCLLWSLYKYISVGTDWGVLDGTCMFAITGGIWLSCYSSDVFERLFKILSIIGISYFLYLIVVNGIDLSDILSRKLVWTDVFYWNGIYWATIPAVLLTVIKKKNIWFTAPYWLCGFLYELLFQKRYIFVDSIILLIIILYFFYKKSILSFGTIIKALFGLGAVVGIVYVLMQYQPVELAVESTLTRFQSIGHISDIDRIRESRAFFSEASLTDIIFGKGFWASHMYLLKNNPALHIGWSNFIFKGGIIYLILVVIPFLNALIKVRHIEKYTDDSQFAIMVTIVLSMRLFYINYFSFQPEMLFLSYGCVMMMCGLKRVDEAQK